MQVDDHRPGTYPRLASQSTLSATQSRAPAAVSPLKRLRLAQPVPVGRQQQAVAQHVPMHAWSIGCCITSGGACKQLSALLHATLRLLTAGAINDDLGTCHAAQLLRALVLADERSLAWTRLVAAVPSEALKDGGSDSSKDEAELPTGSVRGLHTVGMHAANLQVGVHNRHSRLQALPGLLQAEYTTCAFLAEPCFRAECNLVAWIGFCRPGMLMAGL